MAEQKYCSRAMADPKVQTAMQVKDVFKRYDLAGDGTIAGDDLVAVLTVLGISRSDLDVLLSATPSKGSGLVSYDDFINNLFGVPTNQISIHSTVAGDEVAIALRSQSGVIVQRTTTEVLMKLEDGYELWFDIEDVEGEQVNVHEVAQGGKAKMSGTSGASAEVVDRTTGEIKLRLPGGKEQWVAVEDLEPMADQSPHGLKRGAGAKVVPNSIKARMQQRTTTDAMVLLPNGVLANVGIEDLAERGTAPDPEAEAKLRDIFDTCDISKDGVINKRELIKTLKRDKSVADFFGLQPNIRQEDGSRDQMEIFWQKIDANDDRELCWPEFRAFFLDCMAGNGNLSRLAITAEGKQLALC